MRPVFERRTVFMENKLELNKNINLGEKVEVNFTRELQNDIVLPDYCDDINRIIRVDAKPIIKNKYANKDIARLNGIVAVTVVYISEPYKQLRSFSFANDFDYSLDMPGVMSNFKMTAQMEIGELNCRLLNPRKMTLRVETGILIRSSENKSAHENLNLYSYDADDSDVGREKDSDKDGVKIEKLKQNFETCNILTGENEVRVEENITITDEPAANEIIYADVNIIVDDIKPLYNKAVVKFTAEVKCLYSSMEDKTEYVKIVRRIPSTQIIDVDNLDEKYDCTLRTNLSSLKTDIDVDPYGENKIINIDFMAQLELFAFRNTEYEITVDAYCPKYESSMQNENIRSQRFKGVFQETQEVEDSIVLEDTAIEHVMDIVGMVVVTNTSISDSVITINSNAEMSVMVRSGDGEIQNLDCSIPIKSDISIGEKPNNGSVDVAARILECDARIEAGKLTVTLKIVYECVVFENNNHNIIKTFVIETEKPKASKKDIQMVIYYPGQGESLWNIAKKYDSQISKIMKYNKCDSHNISDRKIIIIPR